MLRKKEWKTARTLQYDEVVEWWNSRWVHSDGQTGDWKNSDGEI